MVSFRTIETGAKVEVDQLRDLLDKRGATYVENEDIADLWIIGADDVAAAATKLERLSPDQRLKSVLVGVPRTIDVRHPPTAGNLAGLLETYQPLGVLSVVSQWNPELAGFIGTKELAARMQAGYMKLLSSRHYGSWLRCAGADAAQFILDVLDASAASRENE